MKRPGNVEHASVSKIKNITEDLPQGVSDALEAVKELNESELKVQVKKTETPSELRDLVLFGKVIEEVRSNGFVIKMSTLTNRQQKELLKKLLKLDNEERLMSVKTFTLAESIISINDMPLVELYNGDPKLTDSEKRHEVVSDLQSTLVEKLFNKYEKMIVESNRFFEEGDLGDKIKN